MMPLTDKQINRLIEKINSQKSDFRFLEDELVDHLACMIEVAMQNGNSFEAALNQIVNDQKIQNWRKNESEINSILTSKKKSMKNQWLAISAGVLFLLSGTIFYNSFDNKEIPEFVFENNVELENELPKKATFVNHIDPPSRAPLENSTKITSGFGMRIHPVFKEKKLHRGIDFGAPIGTPVYATGDGVVEKVITHNKYGKMIIIKHDNTFQSLYAQLSAFHIKTGDTVKKGDVIAATGSSGVATGPHLHYEVLKDGKAVNPEGYFN